MTYSVSIFPRAQRQLKNIPARERRRIEEAIAELADAPRPTGCLKMQGQDHWRLRVGDYRVVYEIDDANQAVSVLVVGHRRDVYRT